MTAVIPIVLLAASVSPDYTSVHETLDETTDVLTEHCRKEPPACDAIADADLTLVQQLEEINR